MKNIIGPPVEGNDFHGRKAEVTYVWKKIAAGNNIHLPSPRRVGKSSFAKRLIKEAHQNKWQTIDINLEKVNSEVEFLTMFVSALKGMTWYSRVKGQGETFLKTIKKIKPTVEMDGVKMSLEWEPEKSTIYSQFEPLIDHNKPTLIFLDELGVFLNAIIHKKDNAINAAQFLHWLRHLRQISNSKIKWIFSSSVGIQNFTHSHNITDTINDLLPYHLKAFDKIESKDLLKKLVRSSDFEITEDIFQEIVDKVDYCLPYFLQVIYQKIEVLIELESHPIDRALVNKAYESILKEGHFNTWIERIEKQYELIRTDLKRTLKHICQEKHGSKRSNLLNLMIQKYEDIDDAEDRLNKTLYILTNDGYLVELEGVYTFRSPLLRDFWFKRFAT